MSAKAGAAERWLPLVKSIASKFARTADEREELIQSGTVGLLKALDRYRENGETAFASFAFKYVEGEIRSHIRRDRLIIVPRRTLEKAAALKRLLDDEAKLSGESPRLTEAAAALGINEAELDELLFLIDQRFVELGSEVLTADDPREKLEESSELRACIGRLPPLERNVIRHRFFDGETQKNTADRLNISQSAVSKAEARAIASLRRSIAEMNEKE